MANENLATKSPSPTSFVEQNARNIFDSKLPLSQRVFIWYDQSFQNFPNLDGHIEFFGNDGSTTVKMFFQLKSSEQDITYHDCDLSFLNYCFQAEEPTFIVFVSIPQGKVYWEHITKSYIEEVLGINNLTTFDQQTKRINFSDERIVDNNAQKLIEECKKHYQDKSKVNAEKQGNISAERKQFEILVSQGQQEGSIGYDAIKEKFASMLGNMTDKMMLYFALIHILKPFYLDQRGEKKRRTLLKFLQITDSQERFLIESLMNANFLGRVGELIFPIRKEEAVSVIERYIDNGQVDLAEITQLFSQNED